MQSHAENGFGIRYIVILQEELQNQGYYKAELLQDGIFFLIHLFARDVLVMKKLEINKTKPTFITSVLIVEY